MKGKPSAKDSSVETDAGLKCPESKKKLFESPHFTPSDGTYRPRFEPSPGVSSRFEHIVRQPLQGLALTGPMAMEAWKHYLPAEVAAKVEEVIEQTVGDDDDDRRGNEFHRIVASLCLDVHSGEISTRHMLQVVDNVAALYAEHDGQTIAELGADDVGVFAASGVRRHSQNARLRRIRRALMAIHGRLQAHAMTETLPMDEGCYDLGQYRIVRDWVLTLEAQCDSIPEATWFSFLSYSSLKYHVLRDVEWTWMRFEDGEAYITFPKGHAMHGLEVPLLRGAEVAKVWCDRLAFLKRNKKIFSTLDGKDWRKGEDWRFLQRLKARATYPKPLSTRHLRITNLLHEARAGFSYGALDGIIATERLGLLNAVWQGRELGPEPPLPSRLQTFLEQRLQPGTVSSLRCPFCTKLQFDLKAEACNGANCGKPFAKDWYTTKPQRLAHSVLAMRTLLQELPEDAQAAVGKVLLKAGKAWKGTS